MPHSGLSSICAILLLPMALVAAERPRAQESLSAVERCARVVESYCSGISDARIEGDRITVSLKTSDRQASKTDCASPTSLGFADSKSPENYANLLGHPSLADMLVQPYPASFNGQNMEQNFDPGRFRNEALFKAVYGNVDLGKGDLAVQRNFRDVTVKGKTVKFNQKNGAADSLQKALEEIQKVNPNWLLQREESGTFAPRTVKGSARLSTHAFGTAIDLLLPRGRGESKDQNWNRQYWQGGSCASASSCKDEGRVKIARQAGFDKVAPEILEIMERNCFIWGGKWHHFDTMHFEYRPEFCKRPRPSCPVAEKIRKVLGPRLFAAPEDGRAAPYEDAR